MASTSDGVWRVGRLVLKHASDVAQATYIATLSVALPMVARRAPTHDDQWIVDGWGATRWTDVGVWKHGLSIYGWQEGADAGFTARHPELTRGRGTIRLRPTDAATISDEELTDLVSAALGGDQAG